MTDEEAVDTAYRLLLQVSKRIENLHDLSKFMQSLDGVMYQLAEYLGE